MTNSNKKYIIIAVTLLAVLGIAMFLITGQKNSSDQPPASADIAASETPAIDNTPAAAADTGETAEKTTEEQPATESAAASAEKPAAPAPATIDISSALGDRILGSTSASMQIAEYASLSCGHCAEFHKKTFPAFKKKYIDTNKVFFVFSDFPLNESAMAGSMIARCMPKDKYFDFLGKLFANQEKWAFQTDYKTPLKKLAAADGMSAEIFDKCLASKELQEGIAKRMKGASAQWSISSTPTFVINNKVMISGAYSLDEMSKIIDEEAKKVEEANKPKEGLVIPTITPDSSSAEKSTENKEAGSEQKEAEKVEESTAPAAEIPATKEGSGAPQ